MQKKSKTKKFRVKAIAAGAISALVSTVLLLFIIALLMKNDSIDDSTAAMLILIVTVIAGLVCGCITKKACKGEGSINAIIGALLYPLLCASPAIINEAITPTVTALVRITAISVAASFFSFKINLVNSNKKFHKKSKK